MKFRQRYLLLLISLLGCYRAPTIDGFDRQSWGEKCSDNRLVQATEILKPSENQLLTSTQNEIEVLLGKPDRHQLYNRNQKIFYYSLDCKDSTELMIRFDALGRAKELYVQLK